jgi:hypothetical protein
VTDPEISKRGHMWTNLKIAVILGPKSGVFVYSPPMHCGKLYYKSSLHSPQQSYWKTLPHQDELDMAAIDIGNY